MQSKRRLSASVDADALAAAEQAVERGRAVSVSAWVNEALLAKAAQDRRLIALSAFIDAYEAEHGLLSSEEVSTATRRLRGKAVTVRGTL